MITRKVVNKSFDPPEGYIFPAMGEKQRRHFCMPCTRWFEYRCWESEQSADAELWHHTHQRCTVLRRLLPSESDYEMYEIRFADGFTAIAGVDELWRSVRMFDRPDYLPQSNTR